jgi:hypothetical protein
MSRTKFMFSGVIDAICAAGWQDLDRGELTDVAWAYYYFSIQFRENLVLARELLPDDAKLQHLAREEMNTDNLSPWHGVAERGERMNHDEFMRRTLQLSPPELGRRRALERAGEAYLQKVRQMSAKSRAVSIASYEDGGLESVFKAFLRAPDWNSDTLRAFRHFLTEHIRFDSDEDAGHGALARHLKPDDEILPLWVAFRDLLVEAVPALAQSARVVVERGEPEAVAG